MNKKSQSVMAGLIIVLVFTGLFYLAMGTGVRTEGQADQIVNCHTPVNYNLPQCHPPQDSFVAQDGGGSVRDTQLFPRINDLYYDGENNYRVSGISSGSIEYVHIDKDVNTQTITVPLNYWRTNLYPTFGNLVYSDDMGQVDSGIPPAFSYDSHQGQFIGTNTQAAAAAVAAGGTSGSTVASIPVVSTAVTNNPEPDFDASDSYILGTFSSEGELSGAENRPVNYVSRINPSTPSTVSTPGAVAPNTIVTTTVVEVEADRYEVYEVSRQGDNIVVAKKEAIKYNDKLVVSNKDPQVSTMDASRFGTTDWAKWDGTDRYPQQNTGAIRTFESNQYTDTFADKSTKQYDIVSGGEATLVSETQTYTVENPFGGSVDVLVVTDHNSNTVRVGTETGPGPHITGTTWDKDVFDSMNLDNEDITRSLNEDNGGGILWVSDTERVERNTVGSTTTYSFRSRESTSKPWTTDRKEEIHTSTSSDRTIRTKVTLEGSMRTGTVIETSFGTGEQATTISESFEGPTTSDDALKTVSIKIGNNEPVSMENEVYANYRGNRDTDDLTTKDAADIAFAYDKLGDAGEYELKSGNVGMYSNQDGDDDKNYESVAVLDYGRRYSEIEDDNLVTSATQYSKDYLDPNSGIQYNEGDVRTRENYYGGDGPSFEETVVNKEGDFRLITGVDGDGNDYTTNFVLEDGILTTSTNFNGWEFKLNTREGYYEVQDGSSINGYSVFDDEGNPLIVNSEGDWVKAADQDDLTDAERDRIEGAKEQAGKAIGLDQKAADRQKKSKNGSNKKPGVSGFASKLAAIEFIATEFQGLSGFSTLFFDDETLMEWRQNVDRMFASTYLGTEYFASAICIESIDRVGNGVLYVTSPSGMIEVSAHVEAERSELSFGDADVDQEYLYRISFYVQNPNGVIRRRADQRPDMNFNVILYGSQTKRLYNQQITLQEGDSFRRTGAESIVQYSKNVYNKICVEFEQPVFTADGENVETVCNKINTFTGSPTSYEQQMAGGSGGSGGSGGPLTENAI